MSKLLEQLKRHEGFRTQLYADTVGKLTIGYGHNIEDLGVSGSVAELMLAEDVAIAYEAAMTMDYYPRLNPARQDAITNMVFNMGLTKFLGFKNMNAALFIGDYDLAAREALDSKWAVQVGDRARELASQIATGEYAV